MAEETRTRTVREIEAVPESSGAASGGVRAALGERVAYIEWRNYIVYAGFVLVLAFFTITLPNSGFATSSNLMNVVRQTTPVSVMAVGMAFALSAGEIDLSIAGTVALTSLVTALVLEHSTMLLAIPAGLGVGLGIGLVNGLITTKVRIPSFLVTLGTFSIISGIARWATGLQAVPILNERYNSAFGSGNVGPVSTLFFWTAGILIVGHVLFRHMRFGRHVLATGGNKQAALAVGIRTDRIKVAALVAASLTAAIAGMLYAGRLQGARYTFGENDLLTVIAAVVIGGTSLFGGKGSVTGAVVGSLLLGVLNNGLILMGLDVSQQMMAQGVIILLAVALSLRERR